MKTKQEKMMGANISVSVEHPAAEFLLEDIFEKFRAFEQTFSANSSNSTLSKLNKTAHIKPFKASDKLFRLIEIGLLNSLAPGSFLNIAIGPLVKLWRIGFSDAHVPTDQKIQDVLPLIDPNNIILDNSSKSVFFKKEGMQIDLGALAKGYLADLCKDYFIKQGASSGLINLGGNIVTFGKNPKRENGAWNIGIKNPENPRTKPLLVVRNNGGSVVTSGDYIRKLTKGGHTYHHIFNSKTGYPIDTNISSLTILSDKSIDGEIWTTRLYGYPASRIIELVEEQSGIEAVVLTKERKIYASTGAKDMIL